MRRIAAFLLILLLAGCSAPEPPPEEPVPAVTEDSLRALYASEGRVVLDVVPQGEDFLVWYGFHADPAMESAPPEGRYNDVSAFDWVYTEAGIRCRLVHCTSDVASYEILNAGAVKVTLGDRFQLIPARTFPKLLYAYSTPREDGGGALPYGDETAYSEEPYWAPVAEAHAVGQERREVLVDAQVNVNGVDLVFGPPADAEGLQAFYADASSLPLVEIACDEAGQLVLTCRSTALSSGEPETFSAPDDQANYESWLQNQDLPTRFPAGVLPGSNRYLSQAEVRVQGADVLVMLRLTEAAGAYTVETGYLGGESRPHLRLTLREG